MEKLGSALADQFGVTDTAPPLGAAVELDALQDGFDAADVHARLAGEMRNLSLHLVGFARRLQAIREGIPVSRQFAKLVPVPFELLALQLAHTFLQAGDSRVLFDDGRQYLAELGLGLEDAMREVTLDGREFVCVPKLDQAARDRLRRIEAASDSGNDVDHR